MTRQRKGKQNVVYFLNEKNVQISEAKDTTNEIKRDHKVISEKRSSLTIEQFAKLVALYFTYTNLGQTRILLEDVLKQPKDRFDHVIAFSLNSLFLQGLCAKMLHDCMKDKEACEWTLEVLEKAMELTETEAEKIVES